MSAMNLSQIGERIEAQMGDSISGWEVAATDELVLSAHGDQIISLLTFLRDDPQCRYTTLIDICGVDWPGRSARFDVVYHLLSMHKNHRVRVKVPVEENESIPSSVDVFPAANWFEREAFDLYGIRFSGHPDLRRLLTDYGFEGHPLRKDFPLTGHVEVRYDQEQKRVVYEPVNLPQEFRRFDNLSPWEGAKYVVDEQAKGDGE